MTNYIYLNSAAGQVLISELAEYLIAGEYPYSPVAPENDGDYRLGPVYTGQFWEVEVEDPATGDAWAMTQWDAINVKWGLGKPATLTINTIGDTASDVAYVERRSDLVVYRGGVPYFRGRIMQVNDSLTDRGHQIQLSATDYSGMLDFRFLQPADRTTKIIEPVPEKTVVWEPTVQWDEDDEVVDAAETYPNQVFRAKNDVLHDRPSEWSMTKEYSTNADDPDENADLVTYEGSVYECVKDVEKISEWSATKSYERFDLCVEDGVIYRAIGDSDAPDWGDGDVVPGYADRCYPKGFFVYWQPDLEKGDGKERERKGIYRARRDTEANEKPGADINAEDGSAYHNGSNDAWVYHNDAVNCAWVAHLPDESEDCEPGGTRWVSKLDFYYQGTYVVHRGEVYYASRNIRATDRIEVPGKDADGKNFPDIARDPKAPDELSGLQAGWVRFALKGTNRNHIPSESKNYWKVHGDWPIPGSDSSVWKKLDLKRPKLDPTNWELVDLPSRMVRQYKQVGQYDMAWDLIDMTQKKLSGDMGIVRAQGAPGNGGDDDGLPAPSAKPGRKRDRIFEDVSTTISELVTECGSSVDGFDWWIDADRQWWAQTPMRWRDRTQQLALVYGSTVHSIKRGSSYSFFSSVTVEGDRKETVPDTFETASPIHGRWEISERLSDVKKQSTVRERGDQYLASAGFESSFWQMELAPFVYERADIRLGDVCAFQIDFPPRLDLTGLVRIVDISVKVNGNGDVSVSLGCETVAVSEDQNGATPANGIQFRRIDEIDSLGDTIQRLATRIRRSR
jgi:hypothetical protein